MPRARPRLATRTHDAMSMDTLRPALVLLLAVAGSSVACERALGSASLAKDSLQEPAKSSALDAAFLAPDGKVVQRAAHHLSGLDSSSPARSNPISHPSDEWVGLGVPMRIS